LNSPAAEASRPGAGAWRRWFDFPKREQTRAEELANSMSHGLGLVAALVGIPFLVATAARHGDLLDAVGAIVFSASIVALYFSSAVYHGLSNGKPKRVFRVVEHSAIYLLIVLAAEPLMAGLSTPALLLLIAGGLAYTVGVIFFALDSRLQFGHLVWHLFVMAGTVCHYFAVLLHAA
jgi:hemolysin III